MSHIPDLENQEARSIPAACARQVCYPRFEDQVMSNPEMQPRAFSRWTPRPPPSLPPLPSISSPNAGRKCWSHGLPMCGHVKHMCCVSYCRQTELVHILQLRTRHRSQWVIPYCSIDLQISAFCLSLFLSFFVCSYPGSLSKIPSGQNVQFLGESHPSSGPLQPVHLRITSCPRLHQSSIRYQVLLRVAANWLQQEAADQRVEQRREGVSEGEGKMRKNWETRGNRKRKREGKRL